MNDHLVRLGRLLAFLRSPIDQSALNLDETRHCLQDASGNTFPILEGVAALVPDLEGVLRNHYEISTERASTPPLLHQPAAQVLAHGKPMPAYFLGFKLILREMRPSQSRFPAYRPGTLFEDQEGRPHVQVADAALALTSFEFEMPGQLTDSWSIVRRILKVAPPYFLAEERIPDIVFSNYFEILTFFAEWKQGQAQREELPALNPPVIEGLAKSNAPYFRWLFDALQTNLTEHAVLDIGCGDGWLTSVMERAGARFPLGTDIRLSGLQGYRRQNPDCPRGLLAMSDMFRWSYARDSFSFIAVRNNSALSKAPRLASEFEEFVRNLLGSLAPEGVGYLTYVSDGSGIRTDAGFSNLPTKVFIELFDRSGAHVLKTMKMGGAAGHLICRPGDAPVLRSRLADAVHKQRLIAWHQYVEPKGASDPHASRRFLLAVSDFVSQIVHEFEASGKSRVVFYGTGILGYYAWRLLNVNYCQVPFGGFVVADKKDIQRGGALQMLTPQEARDYWGDDQFKVLIDQVFYEHRVLRFPTTFRWEAQFISPDQATSVDSVSDAFDYHFLSGDHDQTLPDQIAQYYLKGRLGDLGRAERRTDSADFEREFRSRFPDGFKGVQ